MSLVFAIGVSLVYLFQAMYPDLIYVVSNVLSPSIAGVAVLLSAAALLKYWGNPQDKFSTIWLCFTLGMVFWFLGELIWAVYSLFLGVEIPYPSIADLLWLLGYVPLIIALQLYIHAFRFAISKTMYVATAVAVSIAAFIVFALLALPVLTEAQGTETVTLIIDLAYPALDLSLFSMSFRGLLIFLQGKIAKAWMLINAANVMMSIADILFSFTTLQGTYYNGHLLELLYYMGYMFFALAFYTHRNEL